MRNTLAIAFAALALTATPAVAEPVSFELRIAHEDLDLTSEDDVKELRQRIRTEVRTACALPTAKTEDAALDRVCVYKATRVAMEQLEEKRAESVAVAAL